MRIHLSIVIAVLVSLFSITPASTTAQDDLSAIAPCGVVDDMIYPIENLARTTIERGYDDFGLFRDNWGGNHLGLDVGFRQQGEPVLATARGLVTLANIEEWDTELGVIILEHVFPDGNIYYTIYGHIELYGTQAFPDVGSCVEMGEILAAIGNPLQSAPHLHYEIRDVLSDDGGPGYTDGNPLDEGWYHPLDFMYLWQLRFGSDYVTHTSFRQVPERPPITQDDGTVVVAYGNSLVDIAPPDITRWSITTDGDIVNLSGLSGNRIIATTTTGQTVLLTDGRYSAVWTAQDIADEMEIMGEQVIIVSEDAGNITVYNLDGQVQWRETGVINNTSRFVGIQTSDSQLIYVLNTREGYILRLLDANGLLLYEAIFRAEPIITPTASGSWIIAGNGQLWEIVNETSRIIADINITIGPTATLTTDRVGNIYLYTGNSDDTMRSWNEQGELRWAVGYIAVGETLFAPILETDNGCILYSLDVNGRLHQFNAMTGELISQITLYAGGNRTRRPSARSLAIIGDQLQVHAGFLTTITFDNRSLGAGILESCVLG